MTKEEFQKQFIQLADFIDDDEVIADHCEVHVSTVKRWRSGIAAPAPKLREQLIKELQEMVENP